MRAEVMDWVVQHRDELLEEGRRWHPRRPEAVKPPRCHRSPTASSSSTCT
ncbi:MAG: hypothetical protein MZU95_16110 [Desulfomicrobium escambiense]|nr:hypothetical protein [Desulfomicrobium escambiense]